LAELKITKYNINNMEKHNKDLEKIRVDRDYLHATMTHTYANCWKLKTKNDSLNVEHNKL
jgi:hypothetical protein